MIKNLHFRIDKYFRDPKTNDPLNFHYLQKLNQELITIVIKYDIEEENHKTSAGEYMTIPLIELPKLIEKLQEFYNSRNHETKTQ